MKIQCLIKLGSSELKCTIRPRKEPIVDVILLVPLEQNQKITLTWLERFTALITQKVSSARLKILRRHKRKCYLTKQTNQQKKTPKQRTH
jgi:hypothetical protein